MTPVLKIAPVNRIKVDQIEAEHLHEVLEPCQTVAVTFSSQKKMQSYRRMIYSINKQGDFRYRTVRDEQSMWGLVIWRMA